MISVISLVLRQLSNHAEMTMQARLCSDPTQPGECDNGQRKPAHGTPTTGRKLQYKVPLTSPSTL